MEDITLNIKPEVDTSDINKDMNKVAENSANAVRKAFNVLTDRTLQSISEIRGEVQKIDDGGAISNIFEKATNAANLFKSTVGKLRFSESMDVANAKAFALEQTLAHIANRILKIQSESARFSRDPATAQAVSDLNTYFGGDINKLRAQIDEFIKARKELEASLRERGVSTSVSDATLSDMERQYAKINDLRIQLKALYTERERLQSLNNKPDNWDAQLDSVNKKISELTSQLGVASKEFYKVGRENGLGQAKADIVETMESLRELDSYTNAIKTFQNQLGLINRSNIVEFNDSDLEKLSQYTLEFDSVHEKLKEITQETENVDEAAKKAGASFSQWRNVIWSISRVLGNIYTLGLDIVRGAKSIANFYKQIWGYVQKTVAWFKKLGASIRGTADEHKQALGQMLKDVIRYTFGIRSLFMFFRKLRKAIKEAFTEMAEQIPEVNAMMSSLTSSVNLVKGSLATALEPILSAISGWLTIILDKLATVIQYIGMFFAALSGRDYVYKANKSMSSFADTTGKAAKEAKELNKQLQGFDELNNLTTKDNKDSGKGDGGPLVNYKKAEIPDWLKNLAEKIKDFLKKLWDPIKRAWDKVGQYVIDAWKRAFNSVKALLHDVLRDFLRAWEELGESIATNFFLIIGDIGNIIANIADALRDAWNYLDNGYKIWKAILKIVDTILAGIRRITKDIRDWTATLNLRPVMTSFRKWLESLVSIAKLLMDILFDIWDKALKPIADWAINGEGSGLQRFFDILTKFNDSLEKSKIEEDLNKIWEAIGRFGINIGEGLLEFMDRMLGYLSEWLNSDDFTEWCESVAEFLDGLDPDTLADDLEQVWRIIKNVAEWVWKTIKYVLDHKDEILDALEFASEHLDAIAKTRVFGKLAIDFARFAANIALLVGSISRVFGGAAVGGAGASAGAGVGEGIASSLSAIAGPALIAIGLLAGLVANFKYLYDTSEEFHKHIDDTWLGKVIPKIKKNLDTIKNSFGGIKKNVGPVIDKVKEFIDALDIDDTPIAFFETLSDTFAALFESITGIETAFAQLLSGDTEGAWETFTTTIGDDADYLQNIFKNLATVITAPLLPLKLLVGGIYQWVDGLILKLTDGKTSLTDIVNGIKDTIISTVTGIKDKLFTTINNIKEDVSSVVESIVGVWNEFSSRVSAIFEGLWILIKAVWIVVTTWFEINVIQPLKAKWEEFTTWVDTNVVQPLKTKWEEFSLKIHTIFSALILVIKLLFMPIVNWFQTTVITPLQTAWETCTTAISEFFSTLWTDISEGAKSTINSIIGAIEGGINGIIDKVNSFLDMFNGAVAFAAQITGDSWSGVELIPHVSIPRLAKGAVIPPNNEFLAVLGDQKHGTNIETPLDTMVEAFNMANRGGNEAEIALLQEQNDLLRQLLNKEFGITEGDIFRSVRSQNSIYKKSTGVSAFA